LLSNATWKRFESKRERPEDAEATEMQLEHTDLRGVGASLLLGLGACLYMQRQLTRDRQQGPIGIVAKKRMGPGTRRVENCKKQDAKNKHLLETNAPFNK
jgi:hypothetical protein